MRETYENLIRSIGPELFILREATLPDIELAAGTWMAESIRRLRYGEVKLQPGFDGEYGKITVMDKNEVEGLSGQLYFFNDKRDDLPKPINVPNGGTTDMCRYCRLFCVYDVVVSRIYS